MPTTSLDELLNGLRAVAEPSRLRLLAICSHGEWTVSELVQVMAQSQPRISRHLKLLADAGLLERFREGGWVFYRRAQTGDAARADALFQRSLEIERLLFPPGDPAHAYVADRLDEYSTFLREVGRGADAERHEQEAARIRERATADQVDSPQATD